MQQSRSNDIIKKAKRVVQETGSRDPEEIAAQRGIIVISAAFSTQKGVYKVIERNRFIFIKEDLEPQMQKIVMLHEIGHDVLHRKEANIFREFNIFDMGSNRLEYEANSFAAEIALPDEEILNYIYQGYDVGMVAKAMESDINLVAIKVANFNRRGYSFRPQESRSDFLK